MTVKERLIYSAAYVRARLREYIQAVIFISLVLLFLAVYLAPRIFIIIGPGEVGVKYDLTYGTQVDYVYPEGLNIIAPWNRMYIYNTRVQETKRSLQVLTADGLMVQLDLSIRYHPEVEMVGVLHQEVGPDYENKIVVPEVEQVIRTSVGKLTAEQLYTGVVNKNVSRAEIIAEGVAPQTPAEAPQGATVPTQPEATTAVPQTPTTTGQPPVPPVPPVPVSPVPGSTPPPGVTQVAEGAVAEQLAPVVTYSDDDLSSLADIIRKSVREVSQKYVLVDDVIITKSVIPEYVQKAIQEKLEQKELAKAQQYRLEQVRTEQQIKIVEADNNRIISASLDAQLLTMKGIEVTKELATSPNSKVIVIGSGQGGLPVILNTER
ncbi:MAG TPA: prohibitin family protein [Pyrinomonadaceae bacterium]|nr:prohibitin family protein [Pyrinomonadaceae bacterium]